MFFNPRFLAPAMPRLEDREVRLAVIRDGDEQKSRLRLLAPFSVENPRVPFGVSVMRTWSSPFGTRRTPLLDRDDPAGVLEDFFAMLARPHLKLPKVLVMPESTPRRAEFSLVRAVAERAALPRISDHLAAQRGGREGELVAAGLARPQHEPPPGPAEREAELGGHGRGCQSPCYDARAEVAQLAAAELLGAPGVHVDVQAERGGGLGDEHGLARCGLDQVRLTLGPHRGEHEAWQAPAAADVRERPRGGRVDRGQACEGIQHVTRRGLGRVADGGDADGRGAHQADQQREPIALTARQAGAGRRERAVRDPGGRFT